MASPYFLWNFLSPVRSLVDHSVTRVGWHTHMKSKFRRSHHSHLSISRTGTLERVCVQAMNLCVYHFLITGDEGGEKCPLMWMIDWVILGLVTTWVSKNFPSSFVSPSLPRDFCQAGLIFFSSLPVSTQDQLDFQVFSRLSWSSHAQDSSACLLEVAVICFKWVHVKSAALWAPKGLKASQAARRNNSCHDEIQTFKSQAQ